MKKIEEMTLWELYTIKGEKITQVEILQNQIQQINVRISIVYPKENNLTGVLKNGSTNSNRDKK